ncbi:MAG: GSU2403 family nucleotidyltransferase fold protein [Rhodoferax sp.]
MLYAYESMAGVRITQGALATQDVDLLWDASRRVEFMADLQRDAGSILAVLHKVDPSFQRRDDALRNECAINDKGFEVEFLRREVEAGDVHPFRFSDDDGDLWPVQARRAAVLAQSPLFSQPVISATGKMATMNTIDPRTFVEFKRWMAGLSDRDPAKCRRDALQADVVQAMLASKLVASALDRP